MISAGDSFDSLEDIDEIASNLTPESGRVIEPAPRNQVSWTPENPFKLLSDIGHREKTEGAAVRRIYHNINITIVVRLVAGH